MSDRSGNLRIAALEFELSSLLKRRVTASLQARGLDVGVIAHELGYELRSAPPGAYDIQYCRSLGYWATRFLLGGGTDAIVTVQTGRLVPIPFRDLIDETTGRIRVRYVNVASDTYRTLLAYMIRLTRKDIEEPESLRALARAGALSEAAFVERFGYLVGGTA